VDPKTKDGLAVAALLVVGVAQLLARPDKTVALLRGRAWDADKIPASWHVDQAIADQAAHHIKERRAQPK
jgi:hypothetical protein